MSCEYCERDYLNKPLYRDTYGLLEVCLEESIDQDAPMLLCVYVNETCARSQGAFIVANFCPKCGRDFGGEVKAVKLQ